MEYKKHNEVLHTQLSIYTARPCKKTKNNFNPNKTHPNILSTSQSKKSDRKMISY